MRNKFSKFVSNFLKLIIKDIRGIIIGAIASTVIFIPIFYIVYGRIPDERLDNKLFYQIKRDLGKGAIVEFYKTLNIHGLDNNTLVCVYYTKNLQDSIYSIRNVSFYDKAKSNFLEKLLNKGPEYKKIATFSFRVHLEGLEEDDLIPANLEAMDLDGNGINELVLTLATTWGDGVAYSALIFYWDGAAYHVSQLPSLKTLYRKQTGNVLDIWELEEKVTGLPFPKIYTYFNGGNFLFGENVDNSATQALFLFATIEDGSVLDRNGHGVLSGMFEWVHNNFQIYPNWNAGQLMLVDKNSMKQKKIMDLIDLGYRKGIIGSARFYKESRFGKLKHDKTQEAIINLQN